MQHNIWCWNTKYYSIKAGGLNFSDDRGLVWEVSHSHSQVRTFLGASILAAGWSGMWRWSKSKATDSTVFVGEREHSWGARPSVHCDPPPALLQYMRAQTRGIQQTWWSQTTYKVISIKTDAQYPPSILATCNPCLLSPLNHFLSTGLAFSNTISQYNIKRGQYQINLDIQLSKLRFEV